MAPTVELTLLNLKVMARKVLIALVLIVIVIQFVRPNRNDGEALGPNEVSKVYKVPAEVHATLQHSCYDCHSNKTNYPWYAHIQPIGWWMQSHINDGKKHLNFSEYATYPEKKARHKFEEIEDAASNGWMPLGSYLWIHKDAQLTSEQAKAMADWAGSLK
jgi:hypothetical protein